MGETPKTALPPQDRAASRQGSGQAINNTMYTLYARGYAQIYEWSPLQATDIPGEFMTVMTKYLMLG
ncbi:hypothetical protein [Moorena producens]|uniref:hypothetical protein n=1 Tax=Moorena producens TaxID=1155739 RepID=UPI003C76C0DF